MCLFGEEYSLCWKATHTHGTICLGRGLTVTQWSCFFEVAHSRHVALAQMQQKWTYIVITTSCATCTRNSRNLNAAQNLQPSRQIDNRTLILELLFWWNCDQNEIPSIFSKIIKTYAIFSFGSCSQCSRSSLCKMRLMKTITRYSSHLMAADAVFTLFCNTLRMDAF
jgi:hypothetical protein